MGTEPADRGGRASPFTRPGFVAAAALVAVVVALGVIVAVTRGGSATRPRAAPPAAPGTTAGTTGAHACGLTPGGADSVPDSAPRGVTWQLYHTVAIPSSSSAGPGVIDGDIARCYAHTPTGALVAAVQIGVRMELAPNWRAVVSQQVLPGPARGKFILQMESSGGNGGPAQPGDYGQLAAFKFVTYSPQTAVIEYVSRYSDGTLYVTTYTVAWSGGDWKLQLQPDGSVTPSAEQVPSLTGFAIWGGV